MINKKIYYVAYTFALGILILLGSSGRGIVHGKTVDACCLIPLSDLHQDSILRGIVLDSLANPIYGANIEVIGKEIRTVTDTNGLFVLNGPVSDNDTLLVFLSNHASKKVVLMGGGDMKIILPMLAHKLEEITVVATGYDQLPKARATGSFTQIDNKLLNRRVSPDLLSRLEHIASGFALDRRMGGEPKFSVRGRSTIFANDEPLIVIDNFPYDGSITNINPNDIESITILKDAAAASIWGVRAGNGVIVITTKRGFKNQRLSLEVNANSTWASKPDIFNNPAFLNASDFIEIEKTLYKQGFYQSWINNLNRTPLSPVVELLMEADENGYSDSDVDLLLAPLVKRDVRKDITEHLLRKEMNHQYSINLRGGTENSTYSIIVGHDKTTSSVIGNKNDRFNINTLLNFSPLPKIDVTTNLVVTQANRTTNGYSHGNLRVGTLEMYPYAQLSGGDGSPSEILQTHRSSYKREMEAAGLRDWAFRPIDEINLRNVTGKDQDVRLNSGVNYTLFDGFNVELRYQYLKGLSQSSSIHDEESYYVRDLVNRYTIISDEGLISNIPFGAIKNSEFTTLTSHTGRFQVNYTRNWLENHSIHLLTGVEVKEMGNKRSSPYTLYGFDPEVLTLTPINFNTRYPTLPRGITSFIPNGAIEREALDRFRSFYANGAYSLLGKYTFSASARIDQSNYFGVRTNQRSVPLWSIGMAWDIHQETFINEEWVPYLKFRATYGINGNLDKSVTAFVTAGYQADIYTGLQRAAIRNPPNPDLRWERISMLNVGIDFGLFGNHLKGSIDFYHRKGADMMGFRPLEATTGAYNFNTASYGYKGNFAATAGEGIDLDLRSAPVGNGIFKWESSFLFNYTTDKVTAYETESTAFNYLAYGAGLLENSTYISPREGFPVFGIYSYRWGGLDTQTGDPIGYLAGEESKDYNAIVNSSTPEDLVFIGRAQPSVFGTLGNSFTYQRLTLSLSITYKFNYVFRRSGLSYSGLFNNWTGHREFSYRWQAPGDERVTSVPSMPSFPYTMLAGRDNFYLRSEALVEKGDHIRLQDIQVSYTFQPNNGSNRGIRTAQLYLYANNLGVIWRANKHGLDPDYSLTHTYLPTMTMAVGTRINF